MLTIHPPAYAAYLSPPTHAPYPRPLPPPPYPLFPFSYTLVCPLLTLFVPAWSAPQDARLIGGALTFQDLSIGDVMTPIDECFSL